MRVRELMSHEVVVVPPEAPIAQCLATMRAHGFRTLPVVDAGRRPLGLLQEGRAAAEVVIAQGDTVGRETLLAVLTNAQEEANRLRIRVAGIFAARRWEVPEGTPMPAGHAVQGGRVITG